MFNKKLLLLPLLLITILVSNNAAQQAPPLGLGGFDPLASGMPFDPNMSEEEIFNQLMQSINAALPEEARESFWQEVAQETERLERETAHMSPEEKDAYFEKLMKDASMAMQPEPITPIQEPTVQEMSTKESEKKPSVEIKEAVETAEDVIKVINSIIKSIESFITKANAFAGFDGKVSSWLQKGRITDWQSIHWTEFQHELHRLVVVLQRFKEKDPKIGLKHLDELRKNELIIQNLKRLQQKLTDYEARIVITPFEIANMSEPTKNACIHVINALTDTIYRNKIMDELLKIIEKFDPTAKKIREEEEKAAKAAQMSNRYDVNIPVRTAGKPETRGDNFNLPSFDDFGMDGGVGRRPSFDYTGASNTGGPQEQNKSDEKKGGKGIQGGSTSANDGKAASEAPDIKKSGEKLKTVSLDKKDDKKTDSTKKEPAQIKHTEAKKNLEDLFRKDLEDTRTIILETPEFQDKESLKQHLLPVIPPAT